jgi:hypothetical protein
MSMAAAKAPEFEELSIKAIAERVGLDRATCKSRLDQHGYEPVREEAKLKVYRFDAEMEAKLTEQNFKLTEAKTRKEIADAEMKELKLREAKGELVAVDEVMDLIGRLFNAMFQDLAVRQPARLANKLFKAKTTADVAKILRADTNRVFSILGDDHEKILNGVKRKK